MYVSKKKICAPKNEPAYFFGSPQMLCLFFPFYFLFLFSFEERQYCFGEKTTSKVLLTGVTLSAQNLCVGDHFLLFLVYLLIVLSERISADSKTDQ